MANIPPCTFTAGDYIIGFDPGHGDEQAAAVVLKRLPEGRIEVLSIETFEIMRESRDRRAEVIPLHFARECPVCENDRMMIVASAASTDLLDCPACVGLRQVDLTSWEVEDVEAMCRDHNVPVRWLAS